MSGREVGAGAERVLRLLLRLYPEDFRDEMGSEWLETYRDGCRRAGEWGGVAWARFWVRATADSVRNGIGERLRPAVTWRRRGNWGRDTQRAIRRLVRAPAFTLATVGTLTVGLGAFAVVWSAVDNVLLEPPSYERPEDLYFVWRDYRAFFDLDRGWLAGPDVVALDTAGGPIAGAVGMRVEPVTVELGEGGRPEELKAMRSQPGLFDLLGVRPALGRVFAPAEVGEGRPAVVVLGHDLWKGRLGADPAAVGREVRLNGEPFTVIGVMPEHFRFARHSSLGSPETADLYTTFAFDLGAQPPGGGSYAGLVRARPGTTPEAVADAVTAVGRGLDEEYFEGGGMRYYPVGLMEDLVARVRPALVVLGLAGAFLVLVITVNLATLLLGRAAQRERELAVSRALGANRWTLARAALLEGGLLGLLGAAGGLLVALRGTRALVEIAPAELPRRAEIAVDPSVVAVVLSTGVLLGLAAGVVPAVWAARSRLATVLRDAAVRGGGGHGRIRRGMVVAQVALSLVLLSAGGVLVRSFERLLAADPGFRATDALTFRVPVTAGDYPDAAALTVLHDRLLAELSAIPGVESTGGLSSLPLTAGADQTRIAFPGAPGNTGEGDHDAPLIDIISATEGAFEALGARIIAGTAFSAPRAEPANEVLIDHTLADEFYPTGRAVGATVWMGDDTLRVAGVLEQPRLYDVHQDGRGQIWRRNREYTYRSLFYVIRSGRPTGSLIADVRAAVRRADPSLPVSQARPIEVLVDASLSRQRLSATLIAAFALGALILAAMGLFGIVSAAVTRRRTELGIRMALGADAGRVLRMVLGDGLSLVGLGLLAGIPGIWVAGRLLRGVVVGISPFDALTLAAVAGALVAVTAMACWIPARRVTAIDPASSLRSD
ncbi:MAG TPA: ADOP family duplicated permease [Longimicrobiales bacterium]|nr:ADOP family duplicated permease [Longimicrobiales bacterium]